LPNCWRPIFLVLPKLYGCQVGLTNCWSCSENTRCRCAITRASRFPIFHRALTGTTKKNAQVDTFQT
jgi:hypothetical protein